MTMHYFIIVVFGLILAATCQNNDTFILNTLQHAEQTVRPTEAIVADTVAEYRMTVTEFAKDYFVYKRITSVLFFICWPGDDVLQLSKSFFKQGIKVVISNLLSEDFDGSFDLESFYDLLKMEEKEIGVTLDYRCQNNDVILEKASMLEVFNSSYDWLIIDGRKYKNQSALADIDFSNSSKYETVESCQAFTSLKTTNLNIDSEVTVAIIDNDIEEKDSFNLEDNKINNEKFHFKEFFLFDVFNVYTKLGGKLNITDIGKWSPQNGIDIHLTQQKYVRRNSFQGLVMRAVTVMVTKPVRPVIEILQDPSYTYGVNGMTKLNSALLDLLQELYNFSVTYVVTDVWGGMNADGTENGMMGVLQSRSAEVSATGVRYLPERMDRAHFLFQTWAIEVSFFFRVPEESVGPMQSHFVEPLGSSCWACVAASSLLLTISLTVATILQRRRQEKLNPEQVQFYGIFTVIAALCQQVFDNGPSPWKGNISDKTRPYSAAYESGMEPRNLSGRMVYFITFVFSLLLYNYYTSSVVSSLLSAPPRLLGGLEELVSGPLELIFEDIGYTRSLFDNPNYSFQPTRKKLEKYMVAKKVKTPNRKMPIFLNPKDGIELVRKGRYAYQTEPETANPLISDTFDQDEICDLQAIPMLEAPIFIAVEKNSPFKEIFRTGLIRLTEQGHAWRAERLFHTTTPKCDGLGGRALPVPLGRAAPAILVAIIGGIISLIIFGLEFAHARYTSRKIKRKLSK